MAEYSFGERLLYLRKQAGLTQQAVADALNIHRTSYTKYETGVASPDHRGLALLAELFGVSVDYLVGRNATAASLAVSDANGEMMCLSLEEQLLVQKFRQLGYAEQQLLLQQAQHSFRQMKNGKKK